MNRIYRSIWNQATGAYSAVSENVSSAGKRSVPGAGGAVAQFALKALAASMMLGFGSLALAAPTGGVVVAGTATIGGAPGATVINQGSQNAIINWASFNIGQNESVTFQQPNSASVALNRVLGADGSAIMGNLSANGKVFLVNPNGVMFGKGASVNVGGLVASTLDISNADFMAGTYKFTGDGSSGGKVLNQGAISAPGGYVALLGASVSNEGTISARLGSVALAAGRAITLDVAGDGLLNVTVDRGAVDALVTNGGLIQADGGHVLLSAQSAGDLLKTVVNNSGVIEAHTIDTRGGTIRLLGDMQTGTVNAGGTLDTSAPDGGNGGFIDTSAAHVNIAAGTRVTAQAPHGLAGTWLIDPVDFTIAATGGNISGMELSNNLKNADVKILSTQGSGGTAGDINVNDVVNWSANKLTLTAQNNINVNAAMRATGTASLALEYGQAAVAASNTSAYKVNAAIDLPGGNTFSTKLGSNGAAVNYTVINSLGAAGSTTQADLQGMRGGLARNYALGSNIDASATAGWAGGFTPVGDTGTAFTGKFDGLGHDITGLRISSSNLAVGLFGVIGTSGTARNVNLLGASINVSGSGYGSGWGFGYGAVGILAGRNQGQIANVRTSGGLVIQGNSSGGGLAGLNDGTIANSASSATINGNFSLGGLVGQASETSAIIASFATGAINGSFYLGGLVGANTGAIANSYATGNVVGTGSPAYYIGGLVGLNYGSTANLSNSYALGNVTGDTYTGGVVGTNEGTVNNVYSTGSVNVSGTNGAVVGENYGTVTGAYFNSSANPAMAGVGAGSGGSGATGTMGLTAAQMLVPSNFTTFNRTTAGGLAGNNWVTIGADGTVNGTGGTLPMLSAEYSTAINSVHQLQLMALNRTAAYNIASSFSAAATSSGDVWGTRGFIPVGTSAAPFNGSLNGAGRIVTDLAIAKAGATNVGLFGVIGSSGTVANVGLSGGTVAGTVNVGALAGNNLGTISGSFSTAAVTGGASVGGLVGDNGGTIKDSYASGAVTGDNAAGGLAGVNRATIATSYANGAVSAGSSGGGLVGVRVGTGATTGSFWDTVASGQSLSGGGTGMTPAQLKTLANYNSATVANGAANPAWELSNMWVVYDGQSAPLLRSFMKPLTVTVATTTRAYDGTAASAGAASATYSSVVDNNLLFGTLVYTGAGASGTNAGTYAVTASGQYSLGQTGYSITYVAGGLVITPRQISLNGASAGSKVYDGTTSAVLTGGTLSGVLAADLGSVSLDASSLAGVYASKNAGSGIAVSATGGLTGSASGNYMLGALAGVTGTITAKAVTVSGVSAVAKQYDGLTSATLTGGTFSGTVGSETLSLGAATGTYLDANAGIGKAVTVTAASLADGTGLASNYVLVAPTGVTGTITPKALTYTGVTVASKVYDGTVGASGGGTLTGWVGAERVSSGSSAAFADKNAGTGKAVTITTTLGSGVNGGLADNYTVITPAGLTANITKATIGSVSGILANSKVYDGSTAATVNTASGIFNGMIAGDSLTLSATGVSFDTKNAGTAKAVTVTGIALGGADAGNYNLTATTGAGTGAITPKALTIVGMSAVNKAYSGTTQASVTGGSIAGLVGVETLGVTGLTVTFDDKNVGTGKAVTATGTTLVNGGNGGLAANYTMANPTGFTANITPKVLTVSGMTAGSKVYDGLLAAALAGGSLSGLVGTETLVLSGATGAFANQNAGTNKAVTVTGVTLADGTGLASNYTVANPTSVTGTITQKALTVSGATAANKTYDGSTAASIAGGTLDGLVGLETVSLTGLAGAFADQNAGTGKTVAVSGGTLANGANGGLASNYRVGANGALTADITPKALTVTGVSAATRVYNGGTAATLAGGVLNGLVGSETLVLSGLAGNFADKNAGTGKAVAVTGAALANGTGLASNYSVANPVGVTAAITQASISALTGLSATSKAYDGLTGGVVNASGGNFTGMVAGDNLVASGTAVFADKNAGTGKAVTVSGIALGGVDATNYTLATAAGSGTGAIMPKALTIVGMSAVNKVYSGDNRASVTGGSIAGLVGAETLGVTGLTVTFADKNVGTGKAVTATGTTLVNGGNGGLAANYTMANPTGFTASITPKALTVSGMTAGSKVYDGLLDASLSGGTLAGLVTGETLVFTGATGVFADKNAGINKTVLVTGSTIADGTGLASNYTVNNPTTVKGAITQKALTLSGSTAANKTYDGLATASIAGGTLDGMVGTETVGLTDVTGAFADKNAGAGKTVVVTGATLADGANGGLARNYMVGASGPLTADIAQKALTVTGVSAATRVYDGSTGATLAGGALNGLVGAETLVLSGLSGTFADRNAGANKMVTVTGAALGNGTGLASNYTVDNPAGVTGAITQAGITAVSGLVSASKTYDGLTGGVVDGSGGNFTGMVAGDNLAASGTAIFADKNAGAGKAVAVSGITLGGMDAANYTLATTTGTGTGTITPKGLTVTGMTAASRAYDGTTNASLAGGALVGLVGGETLGASVTSSRFADKNVGTAKAVTIAGIGLVDGLHGGLANNYTVAVPTGLLANITPKALTVTGMTASTKVYDGLLGATLSGGSLAGVVAGETLAFSGGTGVFADKNAGTGKAVTVTGSTIADGTGLASNYTVIDPTTVTGTITPKSLTVDGLSAGDKVYDGTTAAQLAGGTLQGLIGTEILGFAGQTATFSDKNAAGGKAVIVSGTILVDGVDGLASNYTVSNPTGLTASITQKALTVIGAQAGSKVYDGSTVAQVSGGKLDGLVGLETLGIAGQTAAFSDKNAAAGKAVIVSGTILVDGIDGLASNYRVSNPTGLTANITQKALTVTGAEAGDKVYDGSTAAQVSGGKLDGLVGLETLGISGQTAAFSDKNAATGKAVTVSGTTLVDGVDGLASNYMVSNPTGLTANIAQKALTVVGLSAADKVYDGTAVAQLGGGTLQGLIGTEILGFTGQAATFSDKNAASGKAVIVSGTILVDGVDGLASNYTVSNPTGLRANITQKALTVIGAQAGDKVYDGSAVAQVAGGTLDGLVGSENLGIAGQAAAFSDKNAASGKEVTVTGTTLVDGMNGLASNYTVSNPSGLRANITQKALTVLATNAGNKVYDGSTVALVSGGTLSGLVGLETLGIAGQTAVFSDKNAASGKAVTVTGTTLVDSATGLASNYTVGNPTGLRADITQKALTVTGAQAGSKVYEGTVTAQVSGGILSGLVGDETLGIGGQTAAFSDKNAATGKAVTVSGTTLVDSATGLASNYSVSNPTGLTASITRAALTGVTGIVASNKVYDGSTAATIDTRNAAFTGMVAGDSLAVAGGSGAFSDKNAAAGKTVSVTGLNLGGADAGNYAFGGTARTTATITQAALAVQVTNAQKDQGRVNPAFSAGYTGLVGGDTVASSVTGALTFATDATTASGSGSYLVAASGQASTNYALTYTPGVLTVNPTEALQNAIGSAVATATAMPVQGGMVPVEKTAAMPLQETVAQAEVVTAAPAVRQNGATVAAPFPGLTLSVVNRGLLLPAELAEAPAPGGSN